MKQYLDMLIDPAGIALRKVLDEAAQTQYIESLPADTEWHYGGKYDALMDEAIAAFTAVYGGPLDRGADRVVFDGGDVVYKIG